MHKFILIIMGIFSISFGLTFILLYLNLLTMGYSVFSFLKFIILNIYCLLFPAGIIMIYFGLKRK